MEINVAISKETIPRPLKIGTTFHTLIGLNFEYWAIVISKKNNGRPTTNSMIANAITNAP